MISPKAFSRIALASSIGRRGDELTFVFVDEVPDLVMQRPRIGEHLKKGLVSWLLGSAGSMGIQLPEKFDLRGILMMISSMLGLTWDAIKARVISRGVPAQAIEAAEVAERVADGRQRRQ